MVRRDLQAAEVVFARISAFPGHSPFALQHCLSLGAGHLLTEGGRFAASGLARMLLGGRGPGGGPS